MISPDHPIIDSHCHVLDPARFPYGADTKYRPSGQEIAPVDHLIRMMDLHDVRHALIVGTNSGYAEDLSPVLDALAVGEGRFKGMAVVANDIPAADLARLKQAGMIGVAFNAPFHGVEHYLGAGALIRKIADLDMILQIQAREDQWLDLLPLVESVPVRLVFDHCGRPAPERGLDQPGFQSVLAFGRSGRAVVKLSGFSQFSNARFPYDDIADAIIPALLDAFTPARCVWGSDFPFLRAPERIDYLPLIRLIERFVPDAADRRAIFWDTPRRLFGF
jgi:predicted TIM-barrel fold metal-dependent hydrolase